MVPFFVQEVVGHMKGMPGLFISCVFSASLRYGVTITLPYLHLFMRDFSTISANLNSMAGIIYSDYIRPLNLFKHNDSSANLSMKLTIVTIGIYCVLSGFIVERVESLFQVINTIAGMTGGAVFGVFSLGMLYPRANHKVSIRNVFQNSLNFVYH